MSSDFLLWSFRQEHTDSLNFVVSVRQLLLRFRDMAIMAQQKTYTLLPRGPETQHCDAFQLRSLSNRSARFDFARLPALKLLLNLSALLNLVLIFTGLHLYYVTGVASRERCWDLSHNFCE